MSLQRAFDDFQAGRLTEAKNVYGQVLANDPSNPEARFYLSIIEIKLNNQPRALELLSDLAREFPSKVEILEPLGACLLSQNRVNEACQTLSRVVEINPKAVHALKNLAHGLSLQGKRNEAVRFLSKALETQPLDVEITIRLAHELQILSRFQESCHVLESFLKTSPDQLDVLFLLGVSYQRMQSWKKARVIYQEALRVSPNHPEVLNNLGVVEQKLEDLDSAEEHLKRAISIQENYAQPYANLGLVLTDRSHWVEAETYLQRAIDLEPQNMDHLNNLGTLYHKWGRLDDAVKIFRRALDANADHANTKMNLGLSLYHQGKKEEALEFYEQAAKLEPQNIEFLRNFSIAFKYAEDSPQLSHLQNVYRKRELSPSDRTQVCFSLGKAHDDFNDFEGALAYYLEGNHLQRTQVPFPMEEEKEFFLSLQKTFSADFLDSNSHGGASSSRPIFILGMPRSGTTLTEQILACHPDVFGAGEIPDLKVLLFEKGIFTPGLNEERVKAMSSEEWGDLGLTYTRGLDRYDTHSPRLINKMPANFMFIGCIALMLPNAVIIHCHRNPIDTCLSCFKHYFQAIHSYKYNLRDLGLYYRMYSQLMNHWREVLPGRFLDFCYEDTVLNNEEQVRKILEHCSLDFHEDCLNFHQSDRAVKTASASQVRKPIYQSSISAWKRYGAGLQPLIDSFTEPIEDLPPIKLDTNS